MPKTGAINRIYINNMQIIFISMSNEQKYFLVECIYKCIWNEPNITIKSLDKRQKQIWE